MPGHVAVVTDSTAYLPAELLARHPVTVVPLQVVVDGRAYDEGSGEVDVAHALRRGACVTTSRPAPDVVLAAYLAAADAGASAVVSVHLSAEMSGTCAAAELAARDAPLPVRVVDSRSLGMGLGFAVLAALAAVRAGADLDAVAEAARCRAAAGRALFYVDTLEYLRRGGRIGGARSLLGSALAVKPLLHLVDGAIEPLERVRTAGRARARLVDLTVERAGQELVDVAVHHLAAPERAAEVAGLLRERIPALGELHVSEVGAVVGAHVGPGLLATVVAPRLLPA
ncbi:MAG TPA: DegV family protein [Actinomycetes bacterium]|nr:DegV family protein [Actinomycetes bacterium]